MSSFKYRRGTSYTVAFPTAPSLQAKPGRVDLVQKQFEHDILILEYVKSSSLWFSTLKTGTPVIFSWSKDSQTFTWVGYVINVSKTSASERNRPMKVFCVGASYVLKARGVRVFKNSSVIEAAQKIAREFGLGFVGEPSTRKFEQLSMTGQSYWQWLQEQAARIGYGMYVRGATLYMRPLDKILNSSTSNSVTLTMTPPSTPAGIEVLDRTLDRFRIVNGDLIESGGAVNTVKATAGVNPLTNKRHSGSQDPKKLGQKLRAKSNAALFVDYSEEVVHSTALSKQAAKDLAESARLTIPAELVGQGDYRIFPYASVFVEGTGPDTDGYWMVRETRHMFSLTGKYQIECSVISDGIGQNVATAFRAARPTPVGTINVRDRVVQNLTGSQKVRTPRLITKIPQILTTQQGFAQLRSVWSGK